MRGAGLVRRASRCKRRPRKAFDGAAEANSGGGAVAASIAASFRWPRRRARTKARPVRRERPFRAMPVKRCRRSSTERERRRRRRRWRAAADGVARSSAGRRTTSRPAHARRRARRGAREGRARVAARLPLARSRRRSVGGASLIDGRLRRRSRSAARRPGLAPDVLAAHSPDADRDLAARGRRARRLRRRRASS